MEKLKFGVIGYGQRGEGITKGILLKMPDVEIAAVCDEYGDRTEKAQNDAENATGKRPAGSTDYRELLKNKDLDGVYIATSWETHVSIAIDALKAGIPVALEVGGAYSTEELWDMVRTQETTGTPVMFVVFCCVGKDELLATSMVRKGLLGQIVHCHGAYGHYLCEEIAGGDRNRHYRLRNYLTRNCENYPTHELGPIAKILNINRGNRMVSLVSVASRAAGMEEYIRQHAEEYPELVGKNFRQGDIVNTVITCADGSTISLRLDTTLPRSYSRELTVRGTKGMYEQSNNYVFLAGDKEDWEPAEHYRKYNNNAAAYEERYLPPVWKNITQEQIEAGHGGMDAIEFRVFTDCLRNGEEFPIDVYDAAAWMSITALSEASVAAGGIPQSVPDFTNGKWTRRAPRDVTQI